ncbi:NALCN channel auxiliary factor 2-like [Tachypleus tridentatus]|uniref:NALCN channel auxiliary factor 2-like n=1 Tax=Tachypleus tridentatus TaxID=6853 RepID=UPI003FD464DA
MTLVADDGSRTPSLEKPYRKVLERWRPCLASLLFFIVVLVDNFVASLSVRVSSVVSLHFRNPWIPEHFLEDRNFNSKVSPTCPVSQGPRQPQCLSLEKDLCALSSSREREEHLLHLYPCFCSHYPLTAVLGPQGRAQVIKGSPDECLAALTSVADLDHLARQIMCEFESVLGRYNCEGRYSVLFSSQACEKVYRQWVCAMLLPFFIQDRHVKPCPTVCHKVEQQCPYFHPRIKEQYAGEPVFKCIDPNIPDIPSITPNSAFGLPGSCYRLCHVNPHLEPGPCNLTFSWDNSTDTTQASLPTNSTYLFATSSSTAVIKAANQHLVAGLSIVVGGLWRHLVTRHCTRRNTRWTWPTNLRGVCKEPTKQRCS